MKAEEIKKFNGTNWYEFESDMMYYLMAKKLWPVVMTTDKVLDLENDEIKEKAMQAIGIIVSRVEPELREALRGLETANAVWEALKGISENKSAMTVATIRSEWESINYSNEQNMLVYLGKLEKCRRLLTGTNAEIGTGEICLKAVKLGTAWQAFTDALMADSNNLNNYEALRTRLIGEYNRKIANEGVDENQSSMAMNANKGGNKNHRIRGNCHNCGKKGHKKDDCWSKGGGKEGQGPRRNQEQDRKAQENDSKAHVSFQFSAMTHEDKNLNEQEWIVDSGATDHMCAIQNKFKKLRKCSNKHIYLANHDKLEIEGIGEVELVFKDTTVILTDVLLVPKISKNLVSVSALAQKGLKIEAEQKEMKIIKQGVVVMRATLNNNLYQINEAYTKCVNLSLNDWHRRMGHLNLEYVKKLESMAEGVEILDKRNPGKCEKCIEAKSTRASFTNKSRVKVTAVGHTVSADLGFISNKAFSKETSFVLYTDHASDFTVGFVLKQKSDQVEAFKRYYTLVTKQFGHDMKVLNVDGGGEFINAHMQKFCEENGVIVRKTSPDTPEQNPYAERKNRTIIETVRAMFLDSCCPKEFWPQAVLHAVYLRNRSPTKANGMEKTPYEIFTGEKPNLKRLYQWGIVAYVHLEKKFRGKLDSKVKRGFLLGLTEKGYLIGFEGGKKVETAHVKFDEQKDKNRDKNENDINNIREKDEKDDDSEDEKDEGEKDIKMNLSKNDYYSRTKRCTRIATPEPIDGVRDVPSAPRAVKRFQWEDINEKAPNDISGDVTDENILGNLESRVTRGRTYLPQANLTIKEEDPITVKEALNGPAGNEWKKAMDIEYFGLVERGTWEQCELPQGRKAITCKWVFKLKRDASGNVVKYKARLVARGFTQEEGIDFTDTYAPVMKFETFRILITLALNLGLNISSYDVVAAYLYSDIDQEIYMTQPENYQVGDGVLRLKKGVYGLRQSAKLWNDDLKKKLLEFGCIQSVSDPGLFIYVMNNSFCWILVYVDDILMFSNSTTIREQLELHLKSIMT
jgi:hypothetical protein